jgi:hypothetical protein
MENIEVLDQGDQNGRIFAHWVSVYTLWAFFWKLQKSPINVGYFLPL